MAKRPISFEAAKAQYLHRFTMDHVPAWAKEPCGYGYYAPQFSSDLDWYENTLFHGESELADRKHCYSTPTWPLGHGFLKSPYKKGQTRLTAHA